MTAGAPPPGRISTRQAVLWGVTFAVIGVLIILFFIYGPAVKPVLVGQ